MRCYALVVRYSRFRNYLYTRIVTRTVKGTWHRLTAYATSVNIFSDFTITCISDETERIQATSELVRVAKSGAIVGIAVMGYLVMLRTVLNRYSQELVTPQYWELIKEGKGNNLVGSSLWHFFRASELQQLAESCGLITLEMVGCEGLSHRIICRD